jgi:NADPH:quinone reductase-like Zn-dependent oxidoreductase
MTEIAWPAVAPVPSTMRAVRVHEFGGPDVLRLDEIPVPEPAAGEVLVRVGAVSIGRLLDLVARSGKHPYAKYVLPHVLGAEHGGTVVALGEDVDSVAIGDHVGVFQLLFPVKDEYVRLGRGDVSPNAEILGTHRQGADAEYVVVPAENVTVVPDDIDPGMVAALAGVGPVAMNQFIQVGGIRPGMNVIVQGATSGLGSTTAMLAKHLGATVVVSSRHESKRARLRELGFEHVFDAIDEEFADQAREAFGGQGADVVVDNLGAPLVWQHGFDTLKPLGSVVSSGAFLGRTVPIDLQRLYSIGHKVIGVRTGTLESSAAMWEEVHLGFRTVFDRSFPLEEAAEAHRYVERNANVGRVVLVP